MPSIVLLAELSDVSGAFPFGVRLKAHLHYFFIHAEVCGTR